MPTPVQTAQVIHFVINSLGDDNGHHTFEQVCLQVAIRRIASNVLPASGPVSAFGDQGRDFETFRTFLAGGMRQTSGFAALQSTQVIAFACTIQRERLKTKLEADLRAICGQGTPVDQVVFFVSSTVPVGLRHRVEAVARNEYGVTVTIVDGVALASMLSQPDLYWIAQQYLHLPGELAPSEPLATVRVLRGHVGPVVAVAWSPDGQRVITTGQDRTARLWNPATGQLQHVLAHRSLVARMAWSPDGRYVATASESGFSGGQVRIWSPDSGTLCRRLDGHADSIESLAWSPDGLKLATASFDATARIWDAETGKVMLHLDRHRGPVETVAWSPDGQWLATSSRDGTARIWNARTGRTKHRLGPHGGEVCEFAWSPDGNLVATCVDNTTSVWDCVSGELRHTFGVHTEIVVALAWSPDGAYLATGSRDATAVIWDARLGAVAHVLAGHTRMVRRVAWSPDGRNLATVSYDHTATVWNTADGTKLRTLHGHSGSLWSVAWSPEGRFLATAGHDQTARIWPIMGTDSPHRIALDDPHSS